MPAYAVRRAAPLDRVAQLEARLARLEAAVAPGDEMISSMPSAGPLDGSEIVPVVRLGSPNLNLSTTTGALSGRSTSLRTVSLAEDYVVLPSDSGTYFDNGGAVTPISALLPTPEPGLNYCFTVVLGSVLQAAVMAGSSIAYGTSVSLVGINSNLPFSSVLVYVPSGAPYRWVAVSTTGGWNVE